MTTTTQAAGIPKVILKPDGEGQQVLVYAPGSPRYPDGQTTGPCEVFFSEEAYRKSHPTPTQSVSERCHEIAENLNYTFSELEEGEIPIELHTAVFEARLNLKALSELKELAGVAAPEWITPPVK